MWFLITDRSFPPCLEFGFLPNQKKEKNKRDTRQKKLDHHATPPPPSFPPSSATSATNAVASEIGPAACTAVDERYGQVVGGPVLVIHLIRSGATAGIGVGELRPIPNVAARITVHSVGITESITVRVRIGVSISVGLSVGLSVNVRVSLGVGERWGVIVTYCVEIIESAPAVVTIVSIPVTSITPVAMVSVVAVRFVLFRH
jgi:hypothetical protein